jgi:SAM-dependent methyltransferase
MNIETFQAQNRISPDELELQRLQGKAWLKPALAKKIWYTPFPKKLIQLAMQTGKINNVLAVGCGPGPEITKLTNLGLNVTALDINPKTVELANSSTSTKFLVSDVLDLPISDRSIGMISMVGVATSLIGRNLNVALIECARVLRPGGNLIISDFLVNPINTNILLRSLRDCLAIRILLGGMPLEVSESLQHVFIIRPFGLRESKAKRLAPEKVAEALQVGNFERLAQHRDLDRFALALYALGFKIITKTITPIKNDRLINIQILAQKI